MTDEIKIPDDLVAELHTDDDSSDDASGTQADPSASPQDDRNQDDMHVDPRHQRRIDLMQQIFAYSFYPTPELQAEFFSQHSETEVTELKEIIAQFPEIDETIKKFAPERPVDQINKVDLAILRSIMFEWKMSQTPKKVLIDEAVELAKEFGTESSPRFVNGVLAKLLT